MANRTITISNETDFLRQSGPIYVDDLRTDASDPKATDALQRDWSVVAKWLGYTTGELTTSQLRKVEKAWVAYLAIGLAPSQKLQPAFASFAEQLKDIDKTDRAPTEIMDVFDRLLASDADIERKRSADMKAMKAQPQPLLGKLDGQRKSAWWCRQSPLTRTWIFASAVWVGVMCVYFGFFDPFEIGGWDRMNENELMRFYLILSAPLAAGAVFYAYRRWVR